MAYLGGMVWVLSIIAATVIGARKGEMLGAFVIGVLLGPIGVIVVWASSGRRKAEPTQKDVAAR